MRWTLDTATEHLIVKKPKCLARFDLRKGIIGSQLERSQKLQFGVTTRRKKIGPGNPGSVIVFALGLSQV